MRRIVCIAILCVVAIVGCSDIARHRLKHWFFDIPGDQPVASQSGESPEPTPPPAPAELVRAESRYRSLHPPYVNRECRSCHDATQRMQPRVDFLDRCRDCHDRYFGEGVGHFPVSDGQCIMCHDMHRSTHAGLLKMPTLEMCVECHDEPEEMSRHPGNAGKPRAATDS